MFSTKIEVDRHVENCLKKLNSETERNSRCFAFAKLYFKVGEYEQARRYVTMYLNVKPASAEAQLLLGKTLEKLGKKDQALEAYRSSLDLDPKQNSLVIKICELLASDDVYFDKCGARYYCQKAENLDPHNPAVFTLKERLLSSEGKDGNDVVELLLKELETRPTDVDIRIRLLRHLLQHNQIKEAYKHASEIEQKDLSVFTGNIDWYQTVAEVLLKYQRDTTLSKSLKWDFWFMLISVLDKVAALSLDEHTTSMKNCYKYVVSVFNLDQSLKTASENIQSCPEKHLVQEFLNHYRGQLCFHLATLLYKQAKKELIPYKEASVSCLPLLFAAYQSQPVDLQSLWLDHSSENCRKQVKRWHREAAFRCSQVGHILLALAKDRKAIILEKATHGTSGMWREQIFKKLFVTREEQSHIKSSFFATCSQLTDVLIRLPEVNSLTKFDEEAQFAYPNSLHHYVWIGLNTKLPQFKCSVFEGLQYSIKNLNNCAAETLNVLDIQAFIYCAVLCAQSQIEYAKHSYNVNPNKPTVMPVAITDQLGTINQAKWLKAAHKMYRNEHTANYNEVRLVLIRGIEVIRCIGNHGLDVKMLVTLANIFAERAKTLTKQTEVEFNEARAELYWKAALPLLEKLKNNQAVTYAPNRLFEYKGKELTGNEVLHHIDCGRLFNGSQLMKKKEHEKALKIFEQLKDPYASFYQAQIYKAMADEQTNQCKENVTSEMRSQNIILLSKVRDYLYLTLDRLRDPSIDRQHHLNTILGTEIEKVERLLSRIDPDVSNNRNECDGMSDENTSSAGSTPDNGVGANFSMQNQSYVFGGTPRQDMHTLHNSYRLESSFRREARPSPERLDAQLRQLTASKDAVLTNILEQNKMMVDAHKSLIDEIKSFKDVVNNLTTTVNDIKTIKSSVEELRDIKQSVDELKSAVNDLQNFRTVTDMVYEMKKELSELKKDSKGKSNQLSDEDLYVLEEDYTTDYNINSNPVGLNPNLYPNFQTTRLQGANNLGYPALYPGPMYPMYSYPGIGLPQPGTLPFADAAQIADFRVGAYPQALTQAAQQGAFNQNLNLQAQPSAASVLGAGLPAGALGQNTLQGTGLTQFKDTVSPTLLSNHSQGIMNVMPTTTVSHVATSKAPPLNVVITASDPLPTTKVSSTQPILSVTIPPQHLKGNVSKPQPHNYQIPLPTTVSANVSLPSVINQNPLPVSTQSLLSNVAPPIYSAIADNKSPNKSIGLGLQIEKNLSESFNNPADVSNASAASEEHDPCPDFKPIIPLPDEVAINTGEENETVLFCERATLYRFTNKEWKERGVGDLKILKNLDSGKVRLLMRRDQVHKVCANHFLTPNMELMPMQNSDRAFIWAANDFADETVVLEKLAVRFKKPEEAQRFKTAFENAKKELEHESHNGNPKPTEVKESKSIVPATSVQQLSNVSTPAKPVDKTAPVSSLGGFVFTSTPTFQPKKDEMQQKAPVSSTEPVKSSPFASFSFSPKPAATAATTTPSLFSNLMQTPPKTVANNFFAPPKFDLKTTVAATQPTQNSENAENEDTDEFVPDAVFKPVIPLPDLVEIKTGEENSEVLFEHKAKLLRFDSTAKEWKERGVGIMKILKEKTIRFVMRREQVLKVCCNHQLLKDMQFTKMAKNPKAVTWAAKDFSEGEFTNETFAIRFKTEDITDSFLDAIKKAKSMLDDSNLVVGSSEGVKITETNITTEVKGDKKSKAVKVEPVSPAKTGWGDKFKPKVGSWECKNCYIVNDGKVNYCVACDTPKNDTVPKKSDANTSGPEFSFGIDKSKTTTNMFGLTQQQQATTTPTNIFGVSQQQQATTTPTTNIFGVTQQQQAVTTPTTNNLFGQNNSWGDAFKPKAGSWECKTCYIRNNTDVLYCVSCENPKDDTVPPKEDKNKGVSLDTGGLTFSFGMPATTNKPAAITAAATTQSSSTPVAKTTFSFAPSTNTSFSFGTPKPAEPKADAPISLGDGKASFTFKLNMPEPEVKPIDMSKDQFTFGSPQKHEFEFKPRSPRRHSSGHGEDESDGSYVEEEVDNIYFKPVIPLPDKVDVITGEEQEEVLYCQRAKLFRFAQGEWKERGIGDIKILRMASNNKLRVLMRREKVLKICLNHVLSNDIKYLTKDEKTWLFGAPDFSEGEINNDQFCLRFKTAEIAKEFKTAIDNALNGTAGPVETESDSDVEFVSETQVSKEEEEEAKKLMLPPKFMSYRQLPDCTCEQCKREDELLKEKSSPAGFTKTIFGKPTNQVSPFTSSIFGGSPLNSSATNTGSLFTKPAKEESLLKDLLSSSSTNTPKPEDSKNSFVFKLDNKTSESPAETPKTDAKSFSFTTNLFASPQPNKSTGSIFGMSPSTPSIFGGANSTTSIFGTNKPNSTIFGSANVATPVFGANSVNATPKSETGSIFSTNNSLNTTFGTLAASDSTQSFASLASKTEENKQDDSEIVLKCDSNLSFASLAANTSKDALPVFGTPKTGDKNPFAFLGAGAPVFGGAKTTPKADKSTTEEAGEEEENGGGGGDDYDPHYDPIVPLPDAITVTTGEEDETVLFNERSKLYRYDAELKEWKERGVGQLKLLHHPEKGTYRLILRREQVHKLVLNMLLNAETDLQPMTTSDKAYLWVGYNFIDEPAMEKLAARFKNQELAKQFLNSVQEVIDKLKKQQEQKSHLPATLDNYGAGDASREEHEEEEDDDDDEDDEEEDVYDYNTEDDERSIMFSSRCTLSVKTESGEWIPILTDGDMKVYYDPDFYGACIIASDDSGLLVSKTIIGVNTVMSNEENICEWRAVEWANEEFQWKQFRANFDSRETAESFHLSYEEGHQFAEECDIIDEIPTMMSESEARDD